MSWIILALLIPVIVAWLNGSTYRFALSLIVLGIALYFVNVLLIRLFIRRRAPSSLVDGSWEANAGLGIVPKWVSVLGLIAVGIIPAGLIVALLLWLEVITNKAH